MNIYKATYEALRNALHTIRTWQWLTLDPMAYRVPSRILDAAIRAPGIGEGWRFALLDDSEIKAQLAPICLRTSDHLYAK